MQIALIHAPLFSRAKIKQPSNLQSCKRNIAHLCLARQNNSSRNVIKSVFNVDLHHNPVRVQVEKGLDAKRNGHIASRG